MGEYLLSEKLYKESGVPEFLKNLSKSLRSKQKIVLFGAGTGGMAAYDWMEKNGCADKVVAFCDNNARKWGTLLCGCVVVSPEQLKSEYSDAFIVITCGEGDELEKQLLGIGFDNNNIIMPDLCGIDVDGSDCKYIQKHIGELDYIYSLLADEKSKQVFLNILNYRLSHKIELIDEIADKPDQQYFDRELIHFGSDDVFVNCGSYIGDTIENYLQRCNHSYKKVFAIEADDSNYSILRSAIKNKGWKNIVPINKGVWSEAREIHFNAVGSGSGFIDNQGDISILTDTIDNIVSEDKVSFINMDIEGSEYEALLGAYSTIQRCHPTLMISVYHKRNDFIKIPLLIKSMSEDYSLYFRHYRKRSVNETVCYAVHCKNTTC